MGKIRALMINYIPAAQLTLEGFTHPFGHALNPENRWVRLAQLIPWDELARIYARILRTDAGRETVNIRMVIGALIVKHKMGLSDRDTVQQIAENVYIQYFCGLSGFQTARPFDPSLLVSIRKRMGAGVFDAFNDQIIAAAEEHKPPRKQRGRRPGDPGEDTDCGGGSGERTPEGRSIASAATNKGVLKVDATIADQQIKYPTDLSLLDQARQEAERLIDQLWKDAQVLHKPRDYRRVARQAYLRVAKKKRKSQREWRKAIRQQLQYLRRDIKILHDLLDRSPSASFPLNVRDQRLFWVIQLLYDQQEWMYRHQSHSHPHRIVSLYQPWVRPMVRGKDKFQVEFGAKLNVSEIEGFCKVNRIGWESYNESQDLSMQIEQFHHTFGCYPELLLADQIYLTRQNRAMLKEKQIRIVGKPLGRPSKQPVTAYQKQKRKKEQNQRNHIEGKFGQGKIAYGLNRIRARRQDTAESWIAAIFFVMNLVNLLKISGQAIFWLFRQLFSAASVMIRPTWGARIQMCRQYYSHFHSIVTLKPKLTFA